MEILSILIGSGGILGLVGLFFYCGKCFGEIQSNFKSINGRFVSIENRLDTIDRRFECIMQELKEIKLSIQSLEIRISRLETQDEERFRSEIKLLIRDRKTPVDEM